MYRLESDKLLKNYGSYAEEKETHLEWSPGDNRDADPAWIQRYKYEASIISEIIKENKFKKILEIGCGPGSLSQEVIKLCSDIDYFLIDQIYAKKMFEDRNYKGTFIVKNLWKDFDISDMDKDFDFIITNDFLEHITNPSVILTTCYSITKEKSNLFVSVPNWRMGHGFIYRGLFDYDNWIYFSKSHGWEINSVYSSPLVCPSYPKLSSESCMDDSLISSWNWYFNAEKLLQ